MMMMMMMMIHSLALRTHRSLDSLPCPWTYFLYNELEYSAALSVEIVSESSRRRLNATALRPFDNLRYYRRPTSCGLLHCGI